MITYICFIYIFVYFCKMKIVESDNFNVYVFPNDHPPPHCHIIYNDGSEVCVGIIFIDSLYGAKISRKVRNVIINNIDKLADAWDELNRRRIKLPKENQTIHKNQIKNK